MDALTSYMGPIDGHSTTDVRSVLEPVAEFAERLRVSVLGVTHPPKAASGDALRSFTGSFAFVAAPRLALYVCPEAGRDDRRLFLSVKNNLGPKPRGIGFSISTKLIASGIEAPCVIWDDEPVDVTADEAIAAAVEARKHETPIAEAKEFLRDLLADGPVDADEGKGQAEEQGISPRTLARAKKEIGVISAREGGIGAEGKWKWKL